MKRLGWMGHVARSSKRGTGPVSSGTFQQMLLDDVTLAHEVRAHGIPDYYDFYTYPIIHRPTPPADWTAFLGWGEAYETIDGNPQPGTRVELLNYESWLRSAGSGTWTRIQQHAAPNGEAAIEDYSGPSTYPARISMPSGGVSVPVGGGPPPRNYHFWPNGRTTITPGDVGGVITLFRARWAPGTWNPALPNPRLLCRAGADWWRNTTVPGNVPLNNNDIGIGRLRLLTADWQLFTFSTVDPRVTAIMSPEPTAG